MKREFDATVREVRLLPLRYIGDRGQAQVTAESDDREHSVTWTTSFERPRHRRTLRHHDRGQP